MNSTIKSTDLSFDGEEMAFHGDISRLRVSPSEIRVDGKKRKALFVSSKNSDLTIPFAMTKTLRDEEGTAVSWRYLSLDAERPFSLHLRNQ